MRSRLVSIVARYGIPERDAEDLVQVTLLLAWRKKTEISRPDAWLMATLRNQCLMYWRRRRASGRLLERAKREVEGWSGGRSEPGEHTGSREYRGAGLDIGQALATLPERQRRAVVLRVVEGYSYREVARETGYAAGSVRKVVGRGLRALRNELDGDEPERRSADREADEVDVPNRRGLEVDARPTAARRAGVRQDPGAVEDGPPSPIRAPGQGPAVTAAVAKPTSREVRKNRRGRSRFGGGSRPLELRESPGAEGQDERERETVSLMNDLRLRLRVFEAEVRVAMARLNSSERERHSRPR